VSTIHYNELKQLSEKYGLSHIIMLAHGREPHREHIVTYGQSIREAMQAAEFGNRLKESLGWPESLHQQSAKATARIEALESVTAELIENFMDEHDMGSTCVHCRRPWVWDKRDANHTDDCPVTLARVLLAST